MLYKASVVDNKEIEFLFDTAIYNEDMDTRELAAIQVFYEKHGYIPENCINMFLNWLIYSARINVSNKLDDITKASFAGKCNTAQVFFHLMFQKLNLNHMTFNIGDVLGTDPIHAVTCVEIPTMHDNEIVTKTFMLDPTFRQFCIAEENRFERYYEEPRWGVRKSTPHPGYFFNLTEDGKAFAQELIHYGFFEINEDSLKTYFDPFSLYVTPKEAYDEPAQIGTISSTTATGQDYWQRMIDVRKPPFIGASNFELTTPREVVLKEDKKLRNRLLRRNVQAELDAMFEQKQMSSGVRLGNQSSK